MGKEVDERTEKARDGERSADLRESHPEGMARMGGEKGRGSTVDQGLLRKRERRK